MKQFIVVFALISFSAAAVVIKKQELPSREPGIVIKKQELPRDEARLVELEQNKNARYAFETDVVDHINDLTIKRAEQREGLNLKGSFEYSDGYVKRIVEYVADQDGYRIVREESQPLPGPHVDLSGVAEISNKAHGTELKYTVKSVPIKDSNVFE